MNAPHVVLSGTGCWPHSELIVAEVLRMGVGFESRPRWPANTEPIERVLAAARDAGAVVISPRPGQSVEPTTERPQKCWSPMLPWRTGTENPIVAHHRD